MGNQLGNRFEIKKVVITIGLGLLGFFGSLLSIRFEQAPFLLFLQWSFVFPLLASRAYGPLYGLLAGTIGLGAFFPFLVWANNGWANVVESGIYLTWFVYQGYFESMRSKKPQFYNRAIIVFMPFAIVGTIVLNLLFPIAFRLNPPFWNPIAENFMSMAVIQRIAVKEIILMLTGLLFTVSILRINVFRKLLGLDTKDTQKANGRLLIVALTGGLVAWLIFITFNRIFITQTFPQVILRLESPYEMLGLIVCVFMSVMVAVLGMEVAEGRNAMIAALRASETQIRSISNNLSSGMIYQVNVLPSGERQFTYVSDAVKTFYGVTPVMVYQNSDLIYGSIHPEDVNLLMQSETNALNKLIPFRCEVRMKNPDGTYRWSSLVSSPQRMSDGNVVWDGIEFIVTEQKEKLQYIEYLSFHDHLTGLHNRRFYEAEFSRLHQFNNMPISLIMADVNGLKLTNDAFGHDAGDELLVKVAQILKSVCRADDIVARIGGDEFVILLPRTNEVDVKHIVDRLRETVVNNKNEKTILSVSFGWDTKHEMEEDLSKLFIRAEDSMYRRKLSESSSMRSETINLIMSTLYEKNEREQQHCERVRDLCREIGNALEMSVDDVRELEMAGLLHDIGKIGIDEVLLNKEDTLTHDEWLDMKRHPEIGYQILRSIHEFSQISEFVLSHHERPDGKGYPMGLKDHEIPLQAKIISVVDAYDAMTRNRAYRDGLPDMYAVEQLLKHAGTQFDEKVVRTFIEQVLNCT